MKKIVVSQKCSACGICITLTNLLIENPDGTVSPAEAGIIQENQVSVIEHIIKECPSNAISLENISILKSSGSSKIVELIEFIKNNLGNYNVKYPNLEDYQYLNLYFKRHSYGMCGSDPIYRSEGQAIRAGLNEFNKGMYSQKKTIIQEELIKFQTSKLHKYTSYEETPDNYYFKINSEINAIISTLKTLIQEELGQNISPEYQTFKVIPEFGSESLKDDFFIDFVKHLERSDLPRKIQDEIESLDWFDTFVDVSSIEDERGRERYSYMTIDCDIQFNNQMQAALELVLNSPDGVQKHLNEFIKNHFENMVMREVKKYTEYFLSLANKASTNIKQ